jgi:hypothetical protein
VSRPYRHSRSSLFGAAVILLGLMGPAGPLRALDITERLVDLGNKPAEARQPGIARNVWDLQAFQGKLYIGMGSTAANRGPIPVWAFDHAAGRWDKEPELVVEQEAIELFRVINDRLYIPAADPKGEINDKSKFYRRDPDGTWTHIYSTRAYKTAHIRDLALTDGLLLGVGNGRQPHRLMRPHTGAVAIPLMGVEATRDGDHQLPFFRSAITLAPPSETGGRVDAATSQRNRIANWFFSVFRLHDGLYASTRWLSWAADQPEPAGLYRPRLEYPPMVPPFPAVVRWDSSMEEWVAPPPKTVDRLVPVSPERNIQLTLRPWKPVLFGELWFAPIRSYGLIGPDYAEAYNQSVDFVVKPPDGPGLRLVLPDPDALGEAVLVDDGRLYLLANALQPDDRYRSVVFALALDDARIDHLNPRSGLDTGVWREVLSFRSANLSRSFARIDETWYFGLGVGRGRPTAQAGTLLRYDPPK